MSKTYRFNPGFQSDDEAVENFIVRKVELDQVLRPFEQLAALPPRVVIVAPRGAGKTTLCRRVLAEVNREAALRERWHPIFFGEESYAITTPGEFLLECLFHLQERSSEMKGAYEDAIHLSNEKELVERTLGTLRAFSKRIKKKLLIIVENFQVILDDQIGSGAKDLVKRLSDTKTFGVLATSVSQSVTEENVILPPDFLRVNLQPLPLEECRSLWKALTDQEVKGDRIRPLQILTGGSPRLLHILAEFMRTPSLQNLMENLNFLIDQNTEYFKSQLDALPPTERKVFAALLESWDPSTAKQVADSARVNTNIASAMLTRLSERGAVVKEPGQGRAAIYFAAERLFNIYYLMRRRSHPSSRVRALVAFMTNYYDRDELIDTATTLAREACAVRPDNRMDYHFTYDAILSRAPNVVRARILEQTPPDFMTSFKAHQKSTYGSAIAEATQSVADRHRDDGLDGLLGRAQKATDREDFEEAIELYKSATDIRPEVAEPWMRLSLLRIRRGELDEAISAARTVTRLRPRDTWAHVVEGLAQTAAGRTAEARESFNAALEIDGDHAVALTELASLKQRDGDIEGAIRLYQRAHDLGSLSDRARVRYARLLDRQKRRTKAEELLREAVDDIDAFSSRRTLVELLSESGRQDEGMSVLRKAAEVHNDWQSWADLGSFVLARTEADRDAREALSKAIQLGADEPEVFSNLARAIHRSGATDNSVTEIASDLTRRFPELQEAWQEAGAIYIMIGSLHEAEASLRKAIEIKDSANAWLNYGAFLQAQPKRMADAEAAFRRAVALSDQKRFCTPARFLADLLVHKGEEEEARGVIGAVLEKNPRCYCCAVIQGDIAARGGHLDAARKAFRDALAIDKDGIHALTGLSRIVDRGEAEALIQRALAADPEDQRVLLARAYLRPDDPESQIKDALEAVRLKPEFVEGQLFLCQVLLKQRRMDEALEHFGRALKELPQRRELTPAFVDAAMALAGSGQGERVSAVLARDDYGSTMEPLIVALKLKRGESPIVAKEVLEVAFDIAAGSENAPKT